MLAVLLMLAIPGPGVASAGIAPLSPSIAKYHAWVQQFVKQQKIPGAAVALVDRDGIVWSEVIGTRARGSKDAVDINTVFSVQSISKTITATAVMLAAQDGLVDLDRPVTDYLPDFTVNSCFEKFPERKITLRLLLGCAAGFTHEPAVGNNYDCPFTSYEAHYQSIRESWLKFPVGSRYSYSNIGFDIAARVIERASGMPFPQYVATKLFAPLGMTSSTLDAGVQLRNPDRARGTMFGLARLPEVMPFPGAGSAYASAADLAQFVRFHLNLGAVNSRQILKQKYLLDMYTPLVSVDYALGIAIADHNGRFALNHNGGGFGWGATMTWYPQYGIGCVILTNSQYAPGLYELGDKILNERIEGGVTIKDTAFTFDPVALYQERASHNTAKSAVPCPGDSILKSEWEKYTSTYRLVFGSGYVFTWYAMIARWFGYRVQKITVAAKNNGLYLSFYDGSAYQEAQRLTEYVPGLFFTPDGEALDLRTAAPTYRNIKIAR